MINPWDMQAGDTVSIQLLPTARHEGIVGRDGYIIARSRRFGGVFSVPPSVFSNGKLRENHGYIGVLNREETLKRAEARIGEKGYDILNLNCVHFVNDVNGLPRHARVPQSMMRLPDLHDIAHHLNFRRFSGWFW